MSNLYKTWFTAVSALSLTFSIYACSNSNFAGGAGKTAGLTGKDGKDGTDTGGGDTDVSDGEDSDGGVDGEGDGKDGLGTNDGGGSDEADSGDDDGLGGDGEISAKTRHDMTITRGEHDNPFEMQIETIIKGKTVGTQKLTFSENGQDDPTIAKLVCRNDKSTCLRLTFINLGSDLPGHKEVVGGDPNSPTGKTCAWAQENGKSAIVDFDANGESAKGKGTCKASDKDEQLTLTCPQSNNLQVQLCTGD